MKPGLGIISARWFVGRLRRPQRIADRLCGPGRYERTESRQDTRAGSYERSLHTMAGEVNLKVPKRRRQTFETAINGRNAYLKPKPSRDECAKDSRHHRSSVTAAPRIVRRSETFFTDDLSVKNAFSIMFFNLKLRSSSSLLEFLKRARFRDKERAQPQRLRRVS
jgi:hypothetical protein